MAYRRWYDADPKLSSVVHAMEFLNRDTQLYFAGKLLELGQSLLSQQGGEAYLNALDERKKDGLSKSQAKNRWYDRHETLHKAFNYLYALPAIDRREIANKLETPIKIVEGYEKHCARQDKVPESSVIEEIMRSSFREGQHRAQKLYSIYLMDFSESQSSQSSKSGKNEPVGLWGNLLRKFQEALV